MNWYFVLLRNHKQQCTNFRDGFKKFSESNYSRFHFFNFFFFWSVPSRWPLVSVFPCFHRKELLPDYNDILFWSRCAIAKTSKRFLFKNQPSKTAVQRYFFYPKCKNKDGIPSAYGIEAGVRKQFFFCFRTVIRCFS